MKVRGGEEEKRGPATAACEERSTNPIPICCPQHPCRVIQLPRPQSYRVGLPDQNAAADELLEILLCEGEEHDNEPESSVIFLSSSSPPNRPENPMVTDPMFGKINPIEPFLQAPGPLGLPATGPVAPPPPPLPSSCSCSCSSRRKGCGPKKFGIQPPASRVEGFDFFHRERRRCGITAIA